MTMTDPIADMLTRIRNANTAHHESVTIPSSTVKSRIAAILQQEGYIASYKVDQNPFGVGKTLTINLKYGPNRERSIAGVRRVSKPGLRVYAKSTSLPRVLGGLGVAIISTSSGLLTDKQAGKQGVGGEVLAYVW
ncbi:MAG: 30S ribosomal protein S8 [Actinobacteria bacterium]|uniref:Small ribosomal subunit protein uS8 n=1 Tax=Candidatus Fonsibacter lacus TaxID=2576439 RepID=A0A965GDJ1_9PROT|nr:30S ribosomal protein S8 [Candidatus Fonsibacter lacus]